MRKGTSRVLAIAASIVAVLFIGLVLGQALFPSNEYPSRTREEAIPLGATKMLPADDLYPPILHLDLWYDPVPLAGPINTAGAEDSAFITSDGKTMYFFFTPDAQVPANEQLTDQVTGIWRSDWNGTAWSEPQRVWLQSPNKLALDGAAFVLNDKMWFASAREGHVDMSLFIATYKNGRWGEWTYAGDLLNKEYQVGEMHLSQGGKQLYFHSGRPGGSGGYDIWVSSHEDGEWQEPVNLWAVNSAESEGWPFLSQDGKELWFTRVYMGSPAVWRSLKVGGEWTGPELVLSSFAAEPTMDQERNLYFIHHFLKDGVMIEADVYVCYR